jgi:hypothetical protein
MDAPALLRGFGQSVFSDHFPGEKLGDMYATSIKDKMFRLKQDQSYGKVFKKIKPRECLLSEHFERTSTQLREFGDKPVIGTQKT